MLAQLATLAILFSVLLFLLSLPLGESSAARTLRRAAAFSFILAFVPSLLICALQPLIPHVRSAGKVIEFVFAGVGLLAVLAVLSFAAYGFLDLRKRVGTRVANVAEGVRFSKRPPEARNREARQEKDEEEEL